MEVGEESTREGLLRRASFLCVRHRFSEALTVYNEAVDSFPEDADVWNSKGVCLKNMQKPDEAMACYEKALWLDPSNASAMNNKGVVYKDRDQYEQALQCYQNALDLDPNHKTAITNMAIAYADMATKLKLEGRLKEALVLYRKAAKRDSQYSPCLYNMGVLHSEMGSTSSALKCYAEAVKVNPRYVEAYNNMGAIYKNQGRLEDAIKQYEKALHVNPNFEMTKGNIAVATTDLATQLKTSGHMKGGIRLYKRALTYNPFYADAYYNLGVAYGEQFKTDKALVCYKLATHFNPKCAEAYNNLGVIFKDCDNLDEAMKYYNKALEANSNFSQSLNNIGVIYTVLGRMTEAYETTKRAIDVNPQYAEAYNNLGVLYRDQGDVELAVQAYEQCIAIDPNSRNATQNRLLALNYLEDSSVDFIYRESLQWGRRYMSMREPYTSWNVELSDPGRRLRIGYIGPDFFTHSVSYFIHAPLQFHDADNFHVTVFSNVQKEDDKTRRLKGYVDEWIVINNLTDKEAAKLVYDRNIDILVELTGHTANNRLDVVALRPAPIQMTWIGYPNTTGLEGAVQYRITDHHTDPLDTEQQYTEELIRLPNSFLCYTPAPDAPQATGRLPALDNGYVTFGSFNTLAKLGPKVIRLWSRVLKAVPRSHLLVKAKPLANDDIRKKFLKMFTDHGIEPSRLDLMGLIPHCTDHLTTYQSMDIALDTFPYAGTTTSCEALLMGVPVVVLAGNHFHAHNVGKSLLVSIGFPELVTDTEDEYVNLAVKLGRDLKRLSVYRNSIRPKMLSSVLCNGTQFTRHLEESYRDIFQRFSGKGTGCTV